jgi:pimeloyl-ACP methyl ester carboxylesterase
LGAPLLTGYRGGAGRTHVRAGNPPFSHALFPIYVAAFVGGGLALRDPRLRACLLGARAAARPVSTDAESAMNQVESKDGTTIEYERTGRGPALIIVDGAFCSRAFGPSPKLAKKLASHFTVYTYDRRGRGRSGDTGPYAPAREVEDLAALVEAAGGSASLLGLSSGGALALEAAASGLPIEKVIAYEPPYVDDRGNRGGPEHEERLRRLIAQGHRGGAVKYFMKDMVGAPAPMVVMMRLMPWIWRKLSAVAHTLPYDAALMTGFRVPRPRFSSIKVPTLVMNGSKTDARLKDAARTVAAVIPSAEHSVLLGQTHNVNPSVLAPAVVRFSARGKAPFGIRH